MKKTGILLLLFLLCNCIYSQIYRMERITKEDVRNMRALQDTACVEEILYDFPEITTVMCKPKNEVIYSSLITDTAIIVMTYTISYHFTDSMDYFMVSNIDRDKSVRLSICPNEELLEEYFNKKLIEFFDLCTFYYTRKRGISDFSTRYVMALHLIPCK